MQGGIHQDEGMFGADSLVPSALPLLSPQAYDLPLFHVEHREGPDQAGKCPGCAEAASRILASCACVYSSWFLVMRRAIDGERARQQDFRKENGLPKSAKVPYMRPSLSESDASLSDMSESIVRAMFGDYAADYARERFSHAMETGDMRSFKIRLLVIRARDSLKGTSLYPPFSSGMEDCISMAEKMSGCIPDPSPRRMSKAERERLRTRELHRVAIGKAQPELPLLWDGKEENCAKITPDESEYQDIDFKLKENEEYTQKYEDIAKETRKTTCKNETSKNRHINSVNGHKDSERYVTVTNRETGPLRKGDALLDQKAHVGKPRKTRNYNTVEDILADIESGKIEPYVSAEEICADLKSGRITNIDALMFTAALDRYAPTIVDDEVVEEETEGVDEDLYSEEEGYEEEEYREEPHEERQGRPSFSYNPNGFGGVDALGDGDGW